MRAELTAVLLALLLLPAAADAQSPGPVPVILDTDIGTDIDDAYALAALIACRSRVARRHHGFERCGRARAARRQTAARGRRQVVRVPVYAGISTPTQYMKQVEWAAGFSSPSLHDSGGVDFMRREINARPGKITLIAVGELTNVAALLESEPGIGEEDPRHRADGRLYLPRLRAGLEARARVEHQVERQGRADVFDPACRCWWRRSIRPPT